ncbi:MAG: YybH family protein [Sediminibacterium sp.]|jgi:ketosteroid isomerase-like protein|nr:nuclear transport factor 2 family protein [Chitinophagaceae bacterium]MCA6446636.1 nuclear transport factor 2 family protein [Chitinophagaceae bacterium]
MRRILLTICCFSLFHCLVAQTANKDIALIKSLRAASNEAIAKHDINKMSGFWLDDMVLVRGNSTHLTGKDTIVAAWKKLFSENPKVLYVRTPTQIVISKNDTLAWETGTWKAFNSYSKGGNYSAMWKKTDNTWKILAELFVSLF